MTNEKAVAARLLQVSAVQVRPYEPFTWASGWKSPIYCDNRRVLSHPYERDFIKSELCSVIFEQFPEAESLSGVATAGIAWGAMAADQLKLPYSYVRPKPKEHGMGNQIEGEIVAGEKVLVIEDLISTGKSSLQVCEVLQAAGMEVIGMVAIFSYGFEVAHKAFLDAGIRLVTLTGYAALIEQAIESGKIDTTTQASLLNWRENPASWAGI
jgi:orotate phosphoribosyltransferase